jgi:hypothetical protein
MVKTAIADIEHAHLNGRQARPGIGVTTICMSGQATSFNAF